MENRKKPAGPSSGHRQVERTRQKEVEKGKGDKGEGGVREGFPSWEDKIRVLKEGGVQ